MCMNNAELQRVMEDCPSLGWEPENRKNTQFFYPYVFLQQEIAQTSFFASILSTVYWQKIANILLYSTHMLCVE